MTNVIEIPRDHLPLREALGSRGGLITEWLKKRPEARAKFRVRIRQMAKLPQNDWNRHEWHGVGDGLKEIKWEAGNVPHRVAGFWHNSDFVMLVGFTHKQSVYDPEDWKKIALRHKREVINGERGTTIYIKA
jgi:hypothetical protein